MIRSFASTYELLPQYPVVRVGEGRDAPLARVADFFDLGGVLPLPQAAGVPTPAPAGLSALPGIDPLRLKDALEFHTAIRRPVIRRLDSGEPTPYKISCLFNRRQSTPLSARWSDDSLVMSDRSPTPVPPDEATTFYRGDGTVPGVSAIPIEWPDTANAIPVDEKHVTLPSASAVTDIIHNLANPLQAREYMSGSAPDGTIGLDVPPLVEVGQAFEVVVDVIQAAQLTVTLTPVGSKLVVHSERIQLAQRSSARLEFTLREQGSYVVTAKSVDPMRPAVSDWVVAVTPP